MKPAKFDYLNPESTEQILQCLSEHKDDARILAGGLSLMAMMNYRLVQPKVVVDISRLEELAYIRESASTVEIGAATTQAELKAWPDLGQKLPLLALALEHVGHYQTRARGTVCGSICHAEPSSELPLCLATLGGEVVLRSTSGERVLKAEEFQTGMLATARRPDEMAYAVRFPVAGAGEGFAFNEIAERHGDFAIVAVAAMATGSEVTVGVGGVADRPAVRTLTALAEDDIAEALNALAWELGGDTDIHATARYRRELVRHLGQTTITEALGNV